MLNGRSGDDDDDGCFQSLALYRQLHLMTASFSYPVHHLNHSNCLLDRHTLHEASNDYLVAEIRGCLGGVVVDGDHRLLVECVFQLLMTFDVLESDVAEITVLISFLNVQMRVNQ